MGYITEQESLQALFGSDAAAQAAWLVAQVLVGESSGARATHQHLSVLYDPFPTINARADMLIMECLVTEDGTFYADKIWTEALCEENGNFYADEIFLDVLFDFNQLSPNVKLYIPMSDYLFPELAGLTWDIKKTPKFSTHIASHVSGREVRMSNYAYPVWTWEMTYEVLRAGTEQELQLLMGFFLARSGSFDTFLYKDPDEHNELVGIPLGVGDASLTKFTMFKSFAGFAEPCGYVDPSSIHVYFGAYSGGSGPPPPLVEQTSGWSFISPNQISFVIPVPIDTMVVADYNWYYRVRFGEDAQDYNQFMYQLWELKTLTIQTVKP